MGSGVSTARSKHDYAVNSRLELITKYYDLREKRVVTTQPIPQTTK
jgi:hypothetical protein